MKARTILLAGSAMVLQPAVAHAQDQASGDQRLENETIIVTATRSGAQNVQTVPIAVTAFGAEQIANKNITQVADLGFHVPNLSVVNEAQGSVTFGIRGVNVAVDNFAFDSAVGIYHNDVYVARTSDIMSLMFDVGSVEVLRGPQGTTFGRNTPTGAIVINSKRPGKEFGGYVKAGFGFGKSSPSADRFMWTGEAAVDVPLGADWAVRIAGGFQSDDGYGRSVVSNLKYNSRRDWIVRGTLVGEIGDNLKVTLIGEHYRTRHGSTMDVPVYLTGAAWGYDNLLPGTATPLADTLRRQLALGSIDETRSQFVNTEYFGNRADQSSGLGRGIGNSASLQLDWDIADTVNLRSITAYRDVDQGSVSDSNTVEFPRNETFLHLQQKQYSQEFLLAARPTDRFKFLAGLFMFKEQGSDENFIPGFVIDAASQLGLPTTKGSIASGGTYTPLDILLRGQGIEYKALGVFTNVSWEFLPGLTASGGIRLSREDKKVDLASGFFTPAFVPAAVGTTTFKDSPVLYDAKLTWQATDRVLTYLKYGTGYRAGGVGFRAANSRFLPEKVRTWEAGAKLDFDLGAVPVRANIAAFDTRYTNFQAPLVLFDPVTRAVSQTVINAGKAKIQGLEAEISAKPTSNLDVGLSVGLLDAHYITFVLPAGNTISPAGAPVDLTNNRLRRAPKFTLTANLGYTVPLGESSLLFQADYNYQSAQSSEPVYQGGSPVTDAAGNRILDASGRPALVTPGFDIDHISQLNVLIKLSNVGGLGLDASVWSKNLLNQRYVNNALALDQIREVTYSAPRTVGITLEKHF